MRPNITSMLRKFTHWFQGFSGVGMYVASVRSCAATDGLLPDLFLVHVIHSTKLSGDMQRIVRRQNLLR